LKFFEEPPSNVVLLVTSSTPARLLSTIRSRLIEIRFPTLPAAQVELILHERGFDDEHAKLGAALSQGSVTRALAALADDEEQLRAQVAAWFFEVVDGVTPEVTWATRETLDEGLEIVKTLVRDWIALSNAGAPTRLLALDYGKQLKKLHPIDASRAIDTLAKITEAQRLARTNVSPALVADYVRMSLTSSAS
jgi:DNA polymerase III subunit delta'